MASSSSSVAVDALQQLAAPALAPSTDSSSSLTRTTGHSRCVPVNPGWVSKLIEAAERNDTAWIDNYLELYISMEQRFIYTATTKQKLMQLGLWDRVNQTIEKVRQMAQQEAPADMVFGAAPHVSIVWSHSLDHEKGTVTFKINQSRLVHHSMQLMGQMQNQPGEQQVLTYPCHEQLRYHHLVKYLQFIELDFFNNPRANALITAFHASLLTASIHFKDYSTFYIVVNWAHEHLQSMSMEMLVTLTHGDKGDWLQRMLKGWSLKRIVHVLENTFNHEKGFGLLWKEVVDRVLGAEKPSKDDVELERLDAAFEGSSAPPPAKRQKSSPVPVPFIVNIYHIDTEQHIGECLHCKERVRVALGLPQGTTVGWGHIRQFLTRQDAPAPAPAPVVAEPAASSSAPHPHTEQHIILCMQCRNRVRRDLGLHGNTIVNPVHVREYMVKQKGSSGVAPPQP